MLWTTEDYKIKSLREVGVFSHSQENTINRSVQSIYANGPDPSSGNMCGSHYKPAVLRVASRVLPTVQVPETDSLVHPPESNKPLGTNSLSGNFRKQVAFPRTFPLVPSFLWPD